jgi:hypothetical protein
VRRAEIALGFPCTRAVPVRLDGTALGDAIAVDGGKLALDVPPHALRTLRMLA